MPNLKITYVPVRELNPFPHNPRRIGQTEMERLRRSIRQFGLVDPLIVRKEDNVLIGGHQRLEAARLEKIDLVPVVYLEGLSEQKSTLLNVALNNTRLQGAFDEVKLAELLRGIEDISLSGFNPDELEDLAGDLVVGEDFFQDGAMDDLVRRRSDERQVTFLFTAEQIGPVESAIKKHGKKQITQELAQLCTRLAA